MDYEKLIDYVNNLSIIALHKHLSGLDIEPKYDGSLHTFKDKLREVSHSLQTIRFLFKEFFKDNDPKKYPVPVASVEIITRFCPYCNQTRNERIIGYHTGENMAYVREFMDKGQSVNPNP